MKTRFDKIDDGLVVKLNYKLSSATKNIVNNYYNSFGAKWLKHDTHQSIGKI